MVSLPQLDGVAPPDPPPRAPDRAWLHAALVALAFGSLAALTWEGWPDLLMDFGRELYLAWRLSAGDVLYRDVASFYGPLSPYVNALCFRLLGAGVRTLALVNMAILAASTAALWWLVRRGSARGPLAATAAAVLFLALCGFAQRVDSGSFNFVAPYSHEATHGFALACAAALAALRLMETGRTVWAAVAGALVGLSFLTKPESFLAAAGTSVACLAIACLRQEPGRRRTRPLAAWVLAAVLPPAAAFALLAAAMPASEAWRGLIGSWAYVRHEELTSLPYFAWSMGTNDVRGNLGTIAGAAGAEVVLFGLAAAAAAAFEARGPARAWIALAVAAATVAVLATRDASVWVHVARPLPLWAAAGVAASACGLWRAWRDEAAFPRHAARFALALFALLLLPRMLLHSRLYHYGFVLAAPAVVLLAAALLDWIPDALERAGRAGTVFRAAALAALAVAAAASVQLTRSWMTRKRWVVGEGSDRMRTDVRGPYVTATLDALRPLLRPEDTLVVLPEGVMINYLLRRRSATPYATLLPTDVAIFGERAWLDALRRDPPAFIVLVHRDTREYGPRFLGLDYGLEVAGWISAHYRPAGRAGDPPLRPTSTFGIAALRRSDLSSASAPAAARP